MARTVAIGIQDFETLRSKDYFYIDKTSFIKEWWESGDSTTLITRPRRFGKTLNMSMLETFFSDSTFKTNPYLYKGMMTGITRVSRESIFSDLNHLKVVTTTSGKYETAFGFTEEEVFAALDECGLDGEKEKVKYWYDGFVFGKHEGIYNP